MGEEQALFVAREDDVTVLQDLWELAREGKPQFLRLQAPFGGGRRAVAGEFMRGLETAPDQQVAWRVVCLDQENGLQWLVRMYGSLVSTLTNDVLTRGRIEMILNAQLAAQPARVQNWYQEFVTTLKESKSDSEKGSINLRMPRDNPLVGLIEVTVAIARRLPIVLDMQNAGVVYSLAISQFLEALMAEARASDAKILVILHDEVEDEVSQSLLPVPLLDLYKREADHFAVHSIAPWGESEVARYLGTKGVTGNAARVAEIAQGRPGFIAELVDILDGKLEGDLADVSFGSLVPLQVDEDELDLPTEPAAEGQPKHAGPADVDAVVYLAALLGAAFPSGLVAQMGGYKPDSVDDLMDAMGDLFEEVQFAKDLGTWIYKFKRGAWRQGVLERNDHDEGHETARRVGLFMERHLVPRGYGFIVKTARVYAEHGAGNRANVMRSVALSNDAPDAWGLSYDLIKYFDEVKWPDPLRRTVFMNLIDRMVGGGPIEATELVMTEATEWAQTSEDREMTAWLLFAGARLDTRRQDFYRARDRANDALKLYGALEDKAKSAEVRNHLAIIELQDGNPNAALEQVEQAIQLSMTQSEDGKNIVPPNIFANAEQVRGLVKRRAGDAAGAIEHFQRANEVAGQTGQAMLALDSGLAFGEAKLSAGQVDEARKALGRVVQIAQQVNNPARLRAACELAAQAEGAAKNWPQAAEYAKRVLQLTQQLKFNQAMPIDLYNLGFFNLAEGKVTEALALFKQAAKGADALGDHPVVKELHFFMGQAALRTGDGNTARESLRLSLAPLQKAGDVPKLVAALDMLASIEAQAGNTDVAKKLLTDAIGFAKKAGLKEPKKALKKKLDSL